MKSSQDDPRSVPNSPPASSNIEAPRNEEPTRKDTELTGKSTLAMKIKQVWAKSQLDLPTLLLMAKGGIPPVIALSMYQADGVAKTYGSLGYLVGIVSILGFAIMPRAKFIQTMLLNLIGVCLGAAMSLLMIWTAIKARQHSQSTASMTTAIASYSSSASAVCGIWLFFQIYLVNSLRAKFPQFAFPTIIYCIFTNVSATYAPQFFAMSQGISFTRQLLIAFMTGFGISTGVSFFILPVNTRTVFFKELQAYIGALRTTLKAHGSFFQSLEGDDVLPGAETGSSGKKARPTPSETVKKAIETLSQLHGKLHSDLPFAKREIAFGKLDADDLKQMTKLLGGVMLPVVGLGSVVDIFQRLSEWHLHAKDSSIIEDDARPTHIREWNEIMSAVHGSFSSILHVMDEGLDHVLITLEFTKVSRKPHVSAGSEDAEEKGNAVLPGHKNFAQYLRTKSDQFYKRKEKDLRAWCKMHGINLPDNFFDNPQSAPIDMVNTDGDEKMHSCEERNKRQLYLLLYMEFLLYSTSQAVLELVNFSDTVAQEGKLAKVRLIAPGFKRLKKWAVSTLQQEDSTPDDDRLVNDSSGAGHTLYLGDAYSTRKDPEHLPPSNLAQRVGDWIRVIPRFLRSPESAFGFRVACATMSIAIVAFLHQSQVFFVKQRLVWAMIMVAISMNPTSGSSTFSYIFRIIGTILAMIVSFLIYYIPDGKTPGILVFLWLFVAFGMYVPIKHPRFIIVGLISVVTCTLIIGYELEVRKIGIKLATSNGQPYYPIYLLAPYRLATVAGGLAVAFIWTFFPYPISERSVLRKTLGASLYLSANYYSIIHEVVRSRIRGDEGDMSIKTSPGRRLEKVRNKVYSKQMLLLNNLQTTAELQKWDVPFGGRFPREEYEVIIECIRNITNYISLVGYASATFSGTSDETETAWLNDFRRLIASANLTSHEITSLLALLSAGITNGQPLPPYLTAPQPYKLSQKLESLDKDILSVRHITERGYAAFAVMQISTRCIIADLEKLLETVKNLVGVLDFSFHIVSTEDSSTSSNSILGATDERKKED